MIRGPRLRRMVWGRERQGAISKPQMVRPSRRSIQWEGKPALRAGRGLGRGRRLREQRTEQLRQKVGGKLGGSKAEG